jgi:type IV secretory pathway VirB9-like protein
LKKINTVALLLILAWAVPAAAATGCKVIKAKGNQVYHIKAQIHKYTHIQLPERFMDKPLTGNDSLWDVDGQGNHAMIKPNSEEPEGKTTTVTMIGAESNKAYQFIVTRVAADPDVCVMVENADASIFKTNEIDNYRSPREREIMGLEQHVAELQRNIEEERTNSGRRINQALRKYRTMIYARYEWKEPVTDVYDDGRFTYIRFKKDNRGLLAVTAEIDDKMEMVQYELDSENVYSVAGIFPKFILKYGQTKVTVTRKDNLSNGVY